MLKFYKKQATFSPNKLKEYVETKEVIEFKEKLYKVFQSDPIFQKQLPSKSLDEVRKEAVLRGNRLIDSGVLFDPNIYGHPLVGPALVFTLIQYDPAVMFKSTFTAAFFGSSIKGLGTAEHSKFLDDALTGKISGCFALTEVAHGSNAKNMRTTATYDKDTKEFVLHTEDFEAAKCWAGNLGQMATHATVFAQLITPDGRNHGLHPFIVPVRDPDTLLPFPGITVGDMGEKIGFHGIDNGYCMFHHYRIPRENLLNRIGTVSDDGEYFSPISDPRKRFAAALGTLIGGRVGVVTLATAYCTNALTIAVRYSAVRKQFGPEDEELAVIEYQLQQSRLFPHLAALFATNAFARFINIKRFNLFKDIEDPASMMQKADELMEMHALTSAAKAAVSWTAVETIQDCREACGGHGYLKCAGIGELRDNNDSNCTYEGENNVLQQQASNWLVSLWRRRGGEGGDFPSPLGSVTFLYERPWSTRWSPQTVEEISHPPAIMEAYQWLIRWLAEKTLEMINTHMKQGKDLFTARNDSQVFHAKVLSIAYIEHFIIKCFWDQCCEAPDAAVKAVLSKLCALYALTRIERHLVYLFQGGFIKDGRQSQLIHSAIMQLLEQLKPEAVALVDAIAPPDIILNSALGHSNGEVYKNLQQAFQQYPGGMQRPSWWMEMSGKFRSKL